MTTVTKPSEHVQHDGETRYRRFSASDRMEHWVLLISFTMLGLTGLPQRYAADHQIARDFIDGLGGIESVRTMHRFFATMLMALAIYHGGALTYKIYVKGVRLSMLPRPKDAQDALYVFLYNLGLRKEAPKMPRFNFGEKAEYLAVVWGTVLMIITGFMLWNPVATTNILPGQFVPAARFAHSAEAFLAIAAIILWHMYNVHIKHFNRAMFTGDISEHAMQEEHAEELEEIQAGKKLYNPPPEEIQAKRRKVFYPYAIVMSILLVAGLVYFVTFEDTALETVPRQQVGEVNEIDASIGQADVGAEIWANAACQSCHGEQGQGVPGIISPLRATDLDIQEFAVAIRRGPADMPAYPPNEVSDNQIAHLYAYFTATASQ